MHGTCLQCGRDVERSPVFFRRHPRTYCSHACVNAANGQPADRLAARLEPAGECHVWTGARTKTGYGQLDVAGVKWYAHRLAWTLVYGPIPDGMHVCHHCDTPPCCRVDHLFLGTDADNLADMRRKGRQINAQPQGTRHGRAKLTDDQVREIRARYCSAARPTQAALALSYGVSQRTIAFIIKNKHWRHLL